MAKKILLMYISEVSGHHSATLAIEEAIRQIDGSAEVMNVNSLSYTSPIGGRVIHSIYMSVIRRFPQFWGWMYDNPKVTSFLEPVKINLHQSKMHKIEKLINTFGPDAVVFSQAYPCGMVAHYKKLHNLRIPLVAVLTDYTPHAYWMYNEVDFYIAPSEETKERFLQNGVSPEKIKLFGIPISPKFAKVYDRESVLKSIGLAPNLKTVLIMGGGHGLGPLDKIAQSLDKIPDCNFQMIAVAGINRGVANRLRRDARRFKKKILVLDFVDNINELMDASDIIITKAGGLTTAESLAKGLAMVIINPIPGQEVNNMHFLIDKNIATCAETLEEVASMVRGLILDNTKLESLRLRAKDFGRPRSSLDIARFLLEL